MRLALTTWNGRISPVFDVARQVLLADVDGGRVTARREENLSGTDPRAQVTRLVEFGPNVLICGAISQPLLTLVESAGIRVLPFTAGASEDIVSAWLAGELPDPAFRMPGCCGQGRRHAGRGPGRRTGRRGWGWCGNA